MKYSYLFNQRRQRRFLKRTKIFFAFFIFTVLAISIIIYIDNRNQDAPDDVDLSISQQTTSYFAADDQIFRTAFFQFQANSSWSQAKPESSEDKFVYRSMRGSIIQEEFIVYVNRTPDEDSITRVLPVTTTNNKSEIDTTEISENCGKLVKADKPKVEVTVEKVRFNCSTNDARYLVALGLTNGSLTIPLKRTNGELVNYGIYYSNLSAVPVGSQFIQIISTFQTR